MGTATPMIMREFHLDKITMGWSVSAFNWTYALFQVPGGWLADRFGSRIVLAGAVTWWSIFTAATGGASGAASLAVMRGLFGMGEAAAWPAASRSLLRWLPVHQRAFGQGFQHSGSRLGAACAPTMVVFLMAQFSWRAVFYLFGGVGVLVAVAWYFYYRDFPQEHGGVNQAEMALLDEARRANPKVRAAVPWKRILRSRDLLFLSLMYFCYGWVFWMYLQWLPTYLSEVRHFTQMKMGMAASLPLVAATIMNVAGGWLSDRLARLWGDLRRGRAVVAVAGFTVAGLRDSPRGAGERRHHRTGMSHDRDGRSGADGCGGVGVVPGHRGRFFRIGHRRDEHPGQSGRGGFRGDDRLSGNHLRMDRAISGIERDVRRGGAIGDANRPEPLGCGRIPT